LEGIVEGACTLLGETDRTEGYCDAEDVVGDIELIVGRPVTIVVGDWLLCADGGAILFATGVFDGECELVVGVFVPFIAPRAFVITPGAMVGA
jgi:hypothetical protein